MTNILEDLAEKFVELKRSILDEHNIDIRNYDRQDYEDEELVDVLDNLFAINEILERYE